MSRLIRRVQLKNYKSIAAADVRLGDLSVLVGPNGAGKSNFVDAITLVADALRTTLDQAIRLRGGINEVRRRSGGHPTNFSIGLHLDMTDGMTATYQFGITAEADGGFAVQSERAEIVRGLDAQSSYYRVEKGKLVEASVKGGSWLDQIHEDRLYLTTLSASEPFRGLFDRLASITSYNLNPAVIKEPQVHDRGEVLERTGINIAGVIRRLEKEKSPALDRIHEYLRAVVGGIERVAYKALGPRETLEFRQKVAGQKETWRFYAANMSDGTLRALGVLTALFQTDPTTDGAKGLVIVEEPESTINPGACSVLMDAMLEASRKKQLIVTTHSPDLLDHRGVRPEDILAVSNKDGTTTIAPIDDASKRAVQGDLYTAGELLRLKKLEPARVTKPRSRAKQLDLFGGTADAD